MSIFQWLPIPITSTSLFVLITNIILALVILYLTARLMVMFNPKPGLALPAALLSLTICIDLARWTTNGLEHPLLSVVFLWLVLRILREAENNQPNWLTFFLAGGLELVRVDGLIYAAMLCLLALLLNSDRRKVILMSLFILPIPILHSLFRIYYYGYPLPNTYYLKMTGWSLFDRLTPGLDYFLRFLRSYGILWLIAAIGVWKSRDRRSVALWLIGIPLILYTIYVGGDDFGGMRFLAPWLPVLFGLAFLTPCWLSWSQQSIRGWGSLMVLGLLVFDLAGFNFLSGPSPEMNYMKLGLALQEMTLPQTTIGNIVAGTLPYFAERTSIDLLGKNDSRIARLPIHPGSLKTGHNKFDYDYSLEELRPDLVVSALNPSILADPAKFASYTQGDDAYSGQLFLSRKFYENYAGSLIIVDNIPVFIRQDSIEKVRLMVGRCNPISTQALLNFGLRTVCHPVESTINP